MNTVSQTLFAAWLAENQPQVFNALAQRAGAQTGQPQQLSGFTDLLSSIGSSISGAARAVAGGLSSTIKSVGGFLGTGAGQQTLTALATTYAASQAGPALQLQADRAAAGQPPAPIQMVWDAAQQKYVATDPAGQLLSAQRLASYQPSFLSGATPWILGGGALLLVTLLFMRKR